MSLALSIRGLKRRSLAVCVALLCSSTIVAAQSSGAVQSLLRIGPQSTTAAPAVAPAAAPAQPIAIPLPDVAARAEELGQTLRAVAAQLPSPEQLDDVKATLNDTGQELESRQKLANSLLMGTPSTLELHEEETYWRTERKNSADLRAQLLTWANAAQAGIQRLDAQKPAWTATLQENAATPDLGPTLALIQKSVSDLQHLTARAQDQLRTIVNLQVQAAGQDELAADILARVEKIRESLEGKLLERDSPPLWRFDQRRETGESQNVFLPPASRLAGIRFFAQQAKGALIALTLLLLVSLFVTRRLYRASGKLEASSEQQADALYLVHHWIALGFLPPLLFAYLLAPVAPIQLIGLAILLSFVPILRLLPRFLQPRSRTLLYWVAAAFAVNAFLAWLALSPVHKRGIQFVFNLGVFALFAFLVGTWRISLRDIKATGRLLVLAIRLAVGVLGASLLVNFFGYVKLAQFLGILCVYSTFVAISMLTGVRVFTRLLLEGIEASAAQQVALVRLHRDAVERWIPRVLQWGGVLVWLLVTLDLLGLGPWLGSRLSQILDFRIAGAGAGVTFGGVIGFFAILLVGYAISTALRFLLREELLRRFHLSRGVPELIASTIHYLLLLLIFLLAVNAGGVELNKFTVITGALGVGVGFGLQNIVNNFISGLILQFERPIHVGDVLDVDGTNGMVTRIGIRASTVRTFQGAEVILPNATFISGKVINWTLSESMRRIELPVGVAYGSDVSLVCKLLDQAATENENILTSPPPAVYFKEFGESSLNFELQFWVMQESNVVKMKSEVALAAIALLNGAGIEIPFPQRDLRLRSVDPIAAAALVMPSEEGSLTVTPRETGSRTNR